MNTKRIILVLGILAVMLPGCALFEREGPAAVVGTWTNDVGTVWTLKADGTFDVDLTKDGKRDAWGKYAVTGDTITVQGTGGMNPKGCKGKGVYKFQRGHDQLHFTLVSDSCKLRKKNVLLGWREKE
jgi:hypothetical protein